MGLGFNPKCEALTEDTDYLRRMCLRPKASEPQVVYFSSLAHDNGRSVEVPREGLRYWVRPVRDSHAAVQVPSSYRGGIALDAGLHVVLLGKGEPLSPGLWLFVEETQDTITIMGHVHVTHISALAAPTRPIFCPVPDKTLERAAQFLRDYMEGWPEV